MFSRTWIGLVGGGAIAMLVAAAWTREAVVEARERSGTPAELRVRDVMDRAHRVPYARIVDMTVDCRRSTMVGARRYVAAVAQDTGTEAVVIELTLDDRCEDVSSATAGSVEPASESLSRALGPGRQAWAVLRPHGSARSLLAAGLLALVGSVLVAVGGWQRRRGEQLVRELDTAVVAVEPEPARRPDPYRVPVAAEEPLLPRPLRFDRSLRWRFRTRAVLARVAAGALLVGAMSWAVDFVVTAQRTRSVWAHGVVASDGHVGPHERYHTLFVKLTDFGIDYTAADGSRHLATYTRRSLFLYWDRSAPLIVKYDPGDPSRFAVSWIVDGMLGEAALVLVVVLLILLVAAVLIVVARTPDRVSGSELILQSGPDELVLTLLGTEVKTFQDRPVRTDYRVRVPWGEEFILTMEEGTRPLFLDLEESQILALHSRRYPSDIVVLHDGGPEVVEHVRLRYRRPRTPGA